MKQKFDLLVGGVLREAPTTAPTRPITKPATTPTKTPSTPNPGPFRRHKPGTMPDIRPKAGAGANLKQELQGIIHKHAKFLKG